MHRLLATTTKDRLAGTSLRSTGSVFEAVPFRTIRMTCHFRRTPLHSTEATEHRAGSSTHLLGKLTSIGKSKLNRLVFCLLLIQLSQVCILVIYSVEGHRVFPFQFPDASVVVCIIIYVLLVPYVSYLCYLCICFYSPSCTAFASTRFTEGASSLLAARNS